MNPNINVGELASIAQQLKLLVADSGDQKKESSSLTLLGKKRNHRMIGRKPNGRPGHAVPRVFRCPLDSCGKIFHDRASLKKHNTVHGDKLFQCPHD